MLFRSRFDRVGRRGSPEGELLLWERRGSGRELSPAELDALHGSGDAAADAGTVVGFGDAPAARIQ